MGGKGLGSSACVGEQSPRLEQWEQSPRLGQGGRWGLCRCALAAGGKQEREGNQQAEDREKTALRLFHKMQVHGFPPLWVENGQKNFS